MAGFWATAEIGGESANLLRPIPYQGVRGLVYPLLMAVLPRVLNVQFSGVRLARYTFFLESIRNS
jgi:hypothetical protein